MRVKISVAAPPFDLAPSVRHCRGKPDKLSGMPFCVEAEVVQDLNRRNDAAVAIDLGGGWCYCKTRST